MTQKSQSITGKKKKGYTGVCQNLKLMLLKWHAGNKKANHRQEKNIFAKNVSNTGLSPETYKELLRLNDEKTKHSVF